LLALFPERRAEQIELADGCARAADGRSLAFAQLAADGLRVTTAFGNDNRLTYTYGSAAAHAAAANYRRRASALCASAASANLCLAATVATYLVVPNDTALVPRRGVVRRSVVALEAAGRGN